MNARDRNRIARAATLMLGLFLIPAAWAQPTGSIVAWGNPNFDVPPPNEGFIAVAGGRLNGLGLKADGSIAAWGGLYGQNNVPEPNTGFVALASGSFHCLGIKGDDGSAVAWGAGECGNSGSLMTGNPASPSPTAPSWRSTGPRTTVWA